MSTRNPEVSLSRREREIRYITSDEFSKAMGRKVPRWEAEQMTIPGPPPNAEKERKRQQRRESLIAQLRGKGRVGQAFQRLVTDRCDEKGLLSLIMMAEKWPWGKPRRKTAKELKRMERVVSDLRAAAAVVQEFHSELWFCPHSDWPIPIEEIGARLRGLAYYLEECLPRLTKVGPVSAPGLVVMLAQEVREKTGRPHFAELAILLSAAYDREISEEMLKAVLDRQRKRRKKIEGNAASTKFVRQSD